MDLNFMQGQSIEQVTGRLKNISAQILRNIEESSRAPEREKHMTRRFNIEQTAKMVGRTKKAIYDAEADGRLPQPDRNEQNRKIGYTLEQMDMMRDVFGTQPYRQDKEDPIVLAVNSFKGGVAKTTASIHVAQHLAMQGYRVLLLDADPQATSTYMMGIEPESLENEETSYIALSVISSRPLKDAVRKTYFHKLDIVPCSLSLYLADMDNISVNKFTLEHVLKLKRSLDTVKHDYDVIIIDPPPNLGITGLNIIAAMNAAIVPVPAAYPDLASVLTYFSMMEDIISSLERKDGMIGMKPYRFIKILVTRYDSSHESQGIYQEAYQEAFKGNILKTPMLYSSALEKSLSMQQSLFEIDRNTKGYGDRSYKRCYQNFESVCEEIETEIRKTWPSHHAKLIKEKRITAEDAFNITGHPLESYQDVFFNPIAQEA